MPAPVIGNRPRYVPRRGAVIDRAHPLSQQIEFCFAPAMGDTEIANGYVGAKTGTPRPGATPFGPGGTLVRSPASTWRFTCPDEPFLGPISILWYGRGASSASASSLVSKCQSNGATNNPFDLLLNDANIAQAVGLVRAKADGYSVWRWSTSIGTNVNANIVLTSTNLDDAPTLSINGARQSAPTAVVQSTGVPTGGTKPISLGLRDDNVTSDATFAICAVWSRVLSVAEVVALAADPFCFLRY